MRILLVNPPTLGYSESYDLLKISMPPLGLAYLAGAAEEEGHEVSIMDCPALNMGIEDVHKQLKRMRPAIVGVTSTTPQVETAMQVISLAKRAVADAWTVLGGPHATVLPKEVLQECPDLDFVVIGEGERTLTELAELLEQRNPRVERLKEIRGMAFRTQRGSIVQTPRPPPQDLETLPLPARHLLPMKDYQILGKKSTIPSVLSSRGCPYRCIFCLTPCIFGRYRGRRAKSVVDEIETIHAEYGFSKFEFSDDLFTKDPKRAMDICSEMIRRGLDLEWGCSARVDLVNVELLRTMKKAGCTTIYYGVESGTQRVLDFICKGTTISQIDDAFRRTKQVGMEIFGSFMIGFPEETKCEIERTIRYAKKLAPSYAQFSIATPYPGTRLRKMVKAAGTLLPKAWSDYTATKVLIRLREISEKQMEAIFRKAYQSFYLSPRFFLSHMLKGHFNIFSFVSRLLLDRATKACRTR